MWDVCAIPAHPERTTICCSLSDGASSACSSSWPGVIDQLINPPCTWINRTCSVWVDATLLHLCSSPVSCDGVIYQYVLHCEKINCAQHACDVARAPVQAPAATVHAVNPAPTRPDQYWHRSAQTSCAHMSSDQKKHTFATHCDACPPRPPGEPSPIRMPDTLPSR